MAKVSRLNASQKQEIVKKILQSSKEKLENMQKEYQELTVDAYHETLPKEVQELIKSHPDYIDSSWIVFDNGIRKSWTVNTLMSNKKSNDVTHLISQKNRDLISKKIREYKEYDSQVDKFQIEIANILDTCSVKEIIAEFPDIAAHIPDKEAPSMLPRVIIDKVNNQLNNLPL